MQPASQSLCDQEINSIFSTADLCIEVIPHEETNLEQIDVDVVLHSQEGLLLEITFSHQNDGLQTEFRNLSQDLEDNILVYNKDAISDNHEECLDILFENDPEHNKLEKRVILDEACYLNT